MSVNPSGDFAPICLGLPSFLRYSCLMSTESLSTWNDRLGWTFGDRIRKIRRTLNIPQGEFADAIGRKRESLSTWESGRVDGPRDVVAVAKRIELAYGVPATWTLGLDAEKHGPTGGPGEENQGGGGSSSRSEPFGNPNDATVIPLHRTSTQHTAAAA